MTKDIAYQVRYTGAGYLDDKQNPVANLSELNAKFDTTELVKGMTVTVIDDGSGKMADYVWDGTQWVKKSQESTTYEAGEYISIVDNVISVTGISTDEFATKDELTAATEGLASESYVNEGLETKADASAITEFVTGEEVQVLIDEAISGITPTEYQAGENIAIVDNVISVTGISTDEFATKDELTAATENLASKSELEDAVAPLASKEELNEAVENLVSQEQLTAATENLATKNEVEQAVEPLATKDELSSAVEDLVSHEELSAATEDLATESFVIEKINEAVISGVTYQAGENIAIVDNVISVTGISTDNFATKEELSAATENLVSNDQLAQAIEPLASKEELDVAVAGLASKEELSAATENLASKEELAESIEPLASKSELEQAIEPLATKDEVDIAVAGLASKEELSAATENLASKEELASAIEPLATKDELTAATDNLASKDEVEEAVEPLASKEELASAIEPLASKNELTAATSVLATKDELVVATADLVSEEQMEEEISSATEGLATESFVIEKINEAVISGVTYEAGENIAIVDNVISVTGISTEGLATVDELTAATSVLASKEELDMAVAGLASKEELAESIEPLATKDELTAATENLASKDEVAQAVEPLASKEELQLAVEPLVTKDELTAATENLASKDELAEAIEPLASKDELTAATSILATKDELVVAVANLVSQDELTAATENLTSKDELAEAIEPLASKEELAEAIEPLATKQELEELNQEVGDAITAATSYLEGEIEGVHNELTALSETLSNEITAATEPLATKVELQEAVEPLATKDELTAATSVLATKDELVVATVGLVSEEELSSAIEPLASKDELTAATSVLASKEELAESVEPLATKDELTAATENLIGVIEESVSGLASEQFVEQGLAGKSNTGHNHDDRYYTIEEADELLAGKSDTGHTHPAYSAGTNVEINDLVISVTGLSNGLLSRDMTTQIGVGFVEAGTMFPAGTPFETILRSIFINTTSRMVLTITLETSDGEDLTEAAPEVTVNGETKVWQGLPLSYLVEDQLPYEITVSNVNGYATPAPVTGVSSAQEGIRNTTVTYQKLTNINYLTNKADFDKLMVWMDEGVVAENPIGLIYPTNFTQQIVATWNQGSVPIGQKLVISATSQEDVNVLSVATPHGCSINSITDDNQSQEILNQFYVQNIDVTISGTRYTKIYSRTVEGGIGAILYSFNIVIE